MKRLFPVVCLSWLIAAHSFAGSATWNLNPTSGAWNTAGNWTPATIPNSSTDTASFAVSNTTAVSISAGVEVNGIVYNPGASAFTTTLNASEILTISGVGITNNSGVTQTFSVGKNPAELHFTNNASAGTQTSFSTTGGSSSLNFGGEVVFSNNSTVIDSVFVNNGGTISGAHGGVTYFLDTTSAGNAVVTNNQRGISTARLAEVKPGLLPQPRPGMRPSPTCQMESLF